MTNIIWFANIFPLISSLWYTDQHGLFQIIPTEDSYAAFNSLEDGPAPSNMTNSEFREMIDQDGQAQRFSSLTGGEEIKTVSMVQKLLKIEKII